METLPSHSSSAEAWLDRAYVRRLAANLVQDEHDADDLVQEVLLYALERPPTSKRSLGAWFRKALRHTAINMVTRDRHRREREADVASAESSEQLLSQVSLRERVFDAVDYLDEPYRTAIYLRYFEGLQPREITQRLQLGPEAVKTRLRRGRERLREILARGEGVDGGAAVVGGIGRADRTAPA